ncbi:hypothetical protein EDD85DRAFT_789587 [Armillaria nabsnona]|nr:hypothetical protein EDD85DRAFT_789587 [Armillaria nabsnona]
MPWEELVAGVAVDSLVDKVVCMFRQRSCDLLKAKYVMRDISFKHLSDYKKFELVGYNRAGTITAAHKHLFDKIQYLVLQDTGELLRYQHLHSLSLSDHCGILHWAADQDGGQAKAWDSTVAEIRASGKAGNNWVENKVQSRQASWLETQWLLMALAKASELEDADKKIIQQNERLQTAYDKYCYRQ